MTPKEKAENLIAKYMLNIRFEPCSYVSESKKCALIALDEVLNYSKNHGFIGLTEFYEEVEKEIKKL